MSGYPQFPGFQAESETSLAAAVKVDEKGTGSEKRDLLLKYFQSELGKGIGMTIDEGAVYLGKELKENVQTGTASARFRELELIGLIVKSNKRRHTRTKSPAKVYFLKGCVPE